MATRASAAWASKVSGVPPAGASSPAGGLGLDAVDDAYAHGGGQGTGKAHHAQLVAPVAEVAGAVLAGGQVLGGRGCQGAFAHLFSYRPQALVLGQVHQLLLRAPGQAASPLATSAASSKDSSPWARASAVAGRPANAWAVAISGAGHRARVVPACLASPVGPVGKAGPAGAHRRPARGRGHGPGPATGLFRLGQGQGQHGTVGAAVGAGGEGGNFFT